MSLDTSYSDNFKHENAHHDLAAKALLTSSDVYSPSYSAVSWGAVLAGTVAAAALSLILVILGVGFGMSSISVWSGQGFSAMTLGYTTIAWLAFTQIIAYGMGGYLAGRLRTKWVSVHTDEVYFRDTAHGFLTWALASLLCAALLASATGAIVGGAAQTGSTLVGGVASAAITGADMPNTDSNSIGMSSSNIPLSYMVGALFRKDAMSADANASTSVSESSADINSSGSTSSSSSQNTSQLATANTDNDKQIAEVMSTFMNSMSAESLPAGDVKYVGQLVSAQTGLPQAEAENRVAKTFAMLQEKKMIAIETAKATAEKTRKTAAYTALWGFVFLLVGAFSASLAATWGGRCRDN